MTSEFIAVTATLSQRMVDCCAGELQDTELDASERLAALAQAGLSIAISSLQACGISRNLARQKAVQIINAWAEADK